MGGIALVLLVVTYTDSYGIAGSVDATWALTGAFLAPLVARLVDRRGQLAVVGPQILVHIVFVIVLVACIVFGAPRWTWYVAAGIAGAALPTMGTLVRARWTYVLATGPLVRTAYSWESVVDEVIFVIGPPLATLCSVGLGAAQAVLFTMVLGATGTAGFLAQRRTEPPASPPEGHTGPAVWRMTGIIPLLGTMAVLGAVFAGVEVAVIALARAEGRTAVAGIVLALWSLSSMVAGLIIGGLHRSPPLGRQLLVGTAVLMTFLLPLPFTTGLGSVTVLLLIDGFAVSPALIAGFALAEQLVPTARLTEGLALIVASLSVGFGTGTTVTGIAVDHHGPHAGFWVAIAAAATALVLAAIGQRWYGRLPAEHTI
jgi:predicted MFS family arabinose efflux permease